MYSSARWKPCARRGRESGPAAPRGGVRGPRVRRGAGAHLEPIGEREEQSLELTRLAASLEDEPSLQNERELPHELALDSVLQQLLRVDLHDAEQRLLHVEHPLGQHRHAVRRARELVPRLELRPVAQLGARHLDRQLGELVRLELHDLVQDGEHVLGDHLRTAWEAGLAVAQGWG